MRLRVFFEVAERDVLTVSGIVDEADSLLIEHSQKAHRTAAMLNVRLAGGVCGREECAVLLFDEGFQFRRDPRFPGTGLFHMRVRSPRTLARLQGLDGRRERDIAGIGQCGVHGVQAAARALTTGKSMSVCATTLM